MKKVDVLMSVYNPDMNYLKEQLISLNNQTYENMEILIFDDCITNRCVQLIFEECLTKKKYRILPYQEENLGYVKAFENLVNQANGTYIAFCDQDDIWDTEKIRKCVECLEKDKTVLVATDRKLIDENSNVYCESVRHSSKTIGEKWNTKEDIGVRNFFQACAPGMCLVMRTDFAKSAIPFSKYTGPDKWLLACANVGGGVSFLDEPLSWYRRYGKNVSGVLVGIESRRDYEKQRVIPHLKLIREFDRRHPGYPKIGLAYRIAYARKCHKVLELIKYRKYIPTIYKFEVVIAVLPQWGTKLIIKILHRMK